MKLLLYGINYTPELTGIGKYTGEMATYFASQGHDVEVITAPPYYPQWSVTKEYRGKGWHSEKIEGVTVHRCPLYVPRRQSGARRILHEFSFVLSSLRYWIPAYFRRYDAIVCISPPFHLTFLPLIHKWLRGTTTVNHIQDLQVDAARELGLLRNPSLLKGLEKAERFGLKRVDKVSSISPGMLRKITEKGIPSSKTLFFPNWVDSDRIHPVAPEFTRRGEWGYGEGDDLILYAGNLGEKQGVEMIIELAVRFHQQSHVKFLIIGEGGAKARLVERAQKLGLTNITFKPLQPLEQLAATLASADVHLVLQKKAAADLVLPSKLTNILAIGGHALVTAEEGSTLHKIIKEHQLGTLVEAEDIEALTNGLKEILSGQRDSDKAGAVAYAATYLDKRTVLDTVLRDLQTTTTTHTS